MEKVINLFICFLWVLGFIGGAGYAIYDGSWPIAVGCVINGVLAFPTVKEKFENLSE